MNIKFRRKVFFVTSLMAFQVASGGLLKADPGVVGEPRMGESQRQSPIIESVLREIKQQALDARYSIKVSDLGDVILLEGEVDSERSRGQIVAAASSAASKRVRDELRIRPALSDDQISERVRSALERDYPNLAKRVQIVVQDGVARLTGDLKNHREVDELLATALMVEGVKNVESDITIAGRAYYKRTR
jgi:osmotically-inducible protein OsmY